MKNIYLIRHCQAEGQPPEAKLTEEGLRQANDLARYFIRTPVERIISSPFTRAVQSVTPLAENKKLTIESEPRLSERILSTTQLPDWQKKAGGIVSGSRISLPRW